MSEWTTKTLGSMCVKIGSGATPTGGNENYKDDGISLIRSQNVGDFTFLYDGLAHIDDEQAQRLNSVTVERNDTLINITGDSVARVCSVPDEVMPARVNQHVSIVRADDIQLDNRFAKYSLLAMKEHLMSISEIGATRRAITKGMLEDLVFCLPKIIEQKAVAEVLSSLDDKIDLLNRQNATLEALAQTYFRQWFIENTCDDWNNQLLSYYVDITRGASPRPIIKYVKDGIFPWVKIGDATSSHSIFINSTKEKIIKEGINKSVIAKKGDIILSNSATCGLPYIMGIDGCVHDGWLVFRNFRYITKWYVYFLLQALQKEIVQQADGTVQDNLNTAILKNISIKVPDVERIKKFDALAKNTINKIEGNNAQILTLQKLRDTLLPKLINGDVRLKGV